MSSAVITSGGVPITSEGAPVEVGTPSYNEIVAAAVLDMPLQDDAASTVVVNNAGTDGTLVGGDNTADLSTTGPTTWLPKALQFDGASDYIDIPVNALNGLSKFTLAAFARREVGTIHNATCIQWMRETGSLGNHRAVILYNGVAGAVNINVCPQHGDTGVNLAADPNSWDADTWYHFAVEVDFAGDSTKLFIDGVEARSSTANYTVEAISSSDSLDAQIASRNSGDLLFLGRLSGMLVSPVVNAVPEILSGPEPVYTPAAGPNASATLASNGAFTVGTWDSQGNGTITYEWRVRNNATVISSGTGESGFATLQPGTNLFEVRASNLGGYGPGDKGDGWYEVASVLISSYWSLLDDPALVARWNGDADGNGTGDVNDAVGSFDWTGSATYADPPFSYSDGKGWYNAAKLTQAVSGTEPSGFTVCGWARRFSGVEFQRLFRTGDISDSNRFIIDGGNTLAFSGAGIVHQSTIQDNTWFHFAASHADGNSYSYLDGIPATDNGTAVGELLLYNNYWLVNTTSVAGADQRSGWDKWDYRVYERRLVDAEIAELYAGPEPSNVSGTLSPEGNIICSAIGHNNGEIIFEWIIVDENGNLITSGTGNNSKANFDSSHGELTLLVRASNDGGYDLGDKYSRSVNYGFFGDGYNEVAKIIINDNDITAKNIDFIPSDENSNIKTKNSAVANVNLSKAQTSNPELNKTSSVLNNRLLSKFRRSR